MIPPHPVVMMTMMRLTLYLLLEKSLLCPILPAVIKAPRRETLLKPTGLWLICMIGC